MSYRKINVDGQTYLWKVGSKYVEIRAEDQRFKKVIEIPAPTKRWAVIYPDLEMGGLRVRIHQTAADAMIDYDGFKKSLKGDFKALVETFPIPDAQVPVTPEWIKDKITSKL